MKYLLKSPLKLKNGEEITELELKRPTWGDIRHLRLGDYKNITQGELLAVAASCAGQPENIMLRLDAADAVELSGMVLDFLSTSPA